VNSVARTCFRTDMTSSIDSVLVTIGIEQEECLMVLLLILRPVDYRLMSNLQSQTATVQMLAKLCMHEQRNKTWTTAD
jgi:hypothetical protein